MVSRAEASAETERRRAWVLKNYLTCRDVTSLKEDIVTRFGVKSQTATTDIKAVSKDLRSRVSIAQIEETYALSVAWGVQRLRRYEDMIGALGSKISFRAKLEAEHHKLALKSLEEPDPAIKKIHRDELKFIEQQLQDLEPLPYLIESMSRVLARQGREHEAHDRRCRLVDARQPWQLAIASLLEDGMCPPELAQLLIVAVEEWDTRIAGLRLRSAEPQEDENASQH